MAVRVPDRVWTVEDWVQGHYECNLATDCGDMVVRRADGVYVYQLAVTVDDGEAGVTEVVRGMDLLSSAPRQMYLQELLDFPHPAYAPRPHAPCPGRPPPEQAGQRSGFRAASRPRHPGKAHRHAGFQRGADRAE